MAELDDWWARWWKEDFTWEGLAEKPWEGWIVREDLPKSGKLDPDEFKPDPSAHLYGHEKYGERPEGWRAASLQDYWRQFYSEDDLISCSAPALVGTVTLHEFTPFHLPLRRKDGTSTEKTDWSDDALDEVILKAISQSRASEWNQFGYLTGPDGRCQFTGGVFKRFQASELTKPPPKNRNDDARIRLHWLGIWSCFEGDLNFHKVSFEGHANFRSGSFEGGAFFGGARFEGNAEFESACFGELAKFTSVGFERNAVFRNASFKGNANFENASFKKGGIFNDISFEGGAFFVCANFEEHANFRDVIVEGNANFRSASFEGNANFENASFEAYAVFRSAMFRKGAYFSGKAAEFRTDPVKQVFSANADMAAERAHWSGKLQGEPVKTALASCAFRRFDFAQGICCGHFVFDNRTILESADFSHALFLDQAKFYGSRLHQGVSFQAARFRDALRPKQYEDLPEWAYARLYENALATAKRRGEQLAEKHVWIAEFHSKLEADWAFKDDPPDRRQPVSAIVKRNTYYDELERCFRTLKLAMEDTRDRNMEGHFFQLELKARRQRTGERMNWFQAMLAGEKRSSQVAWWEPLFSDLYGGLSDYGTSIMRPIVWIVYLMLGFAVVYFLLGSVHVSLWKADWARDVGVYETWNDIWNSLSYSASRMLGFGALGGDLHEGSLLYPIIDPDSEQRRAWSNFGVRLLGTAQSILAIILVFLSGLAVRRKFQIT